MGRNASLVIDVHQSRGVGEQGADMPLSMSNPPGSWDENSKGSNHHPGTVTLESEDNKVQNSIHKMYPVPNTPDTQGMYARLLK